MATGCAGLGSNSRPESATRVLVVATVHGQHRRNPNYRYEDVVRILDAFDPGVVCVEIRPQEFRKEPYLKEMMLATVWAVARQREVCGFDWYADEPTRELRQQLEQQPEYVQKARVFDSLIAVNPITGPFDERYRNYWSGQMSYRFYNGREYNRYFEEWYRLSLAVYGDGPINLHYELRNRRMMDLAWDVIRRYPGARVALLTGSEHKHFFDRDLAARQNVTVVELEDLLPLHERPLDPISRAFLQEDNDLAYYLNGFPRDTNLYYRNKLIDLIHGPEMDWRPDIVPPANLPLAELVLGRWRSAQPPSSRMMFDEAWLQFLNGDCDAAVGRLNHLAEAVERGAIEDPFMRAYTYRNLGLCYDLLGNRPAALQSYARVRALTRGTTMGQERSLFLMLRDYETVPYRRGRTAQP